MEWKVKYVDASAALLKEFRKAKFRALRRLGFKVMRRAQASIHDEKGPSEPGTPPHTHPGENTLGGSKKGQLPISIKYDTEKPGPESLDAVIVGPSEAVVGKAGKPHEHGGWFRGMYYEPRPFMGPALGEEAGELPGLLAEENAKV